MAIYLYGIVPAPAAAAAPSTPGVNGAAVRLFEAERLAGLVSELPDVTFHAGKGDLMAHSDVLQEMLASSDVLPMRFGTVFDSTEDLVRELFAPNESEITSILGHLRGAVEIQIKAAYEPAALAREILATDRTLQKLQARAKARGDVASNVEVGRRFAGGLEQARAADGRSVTSALAPLARDVATGTPNGEYGAVNVSFLVERDEVDRFQEAVGRLQTSMRPSIELRAVGPLPPYSFVGARQAVRR